MADAQPFTSVGLNDTQLEALGRAYVGDRQLYHLSPYFMGMWLDSLLLGILLALFVRWQVNVAATDRRWVKWVVYYLVVLHCGLSGYTLANQIHNFVSGFGEYKNFLKPDWSRPSYIFKALSRLPCSAFFTHRAWMMWKKKWIIPACIVPMFVASAGCAMGVAITFNSQPMPVIGQKLLWTMGTLEVVTDVSLTVLLAVALLRSKTGFENTDKLINHLLRALVETQLPPTISAAAFLAVIITLSDTSQPAYFQAGPKIYPICLLIVISSRISMAREAGSNHAYIQDSIELASTNGTVKPDHIRVDRVTQTVVTQDDLTPYEPKGINRRSPSISDASQKSDVTAGASEKEQQYVRNAHAWA